MTLTMKLCERGIGVAWNDLHCTLTKDHLRQHEFSMHYHGYLHRVCTPVIPSVYFLILVDILIRKPKNTGFLWVLVLVKQVLWLDHAFLLGLVRPELPSPYHLGLVSDVLVHQMSDSCLNISMLGMWFMSWICLIDLSILTISECLEYFALFALDDMSLPETSDYEGPS